MVTVTPIADATAFRFDESVQSERQAMVDSVLGTMGAEGEPPSKVTQQLMHRFVAGDISLLAMNEAILAYAAQMTNEAHARRLAVR